jgi:hypothetical protein
MIRRAQRKAPGREQASLGLHRRTLRHVSSLHEWFIPTVGFQQRVQAIDNKKPRSLAVSGFLVLADA